MSLLDASVEWLQQGTYQGQYNGSFAVDVAGQASDAALRFRVTHPSAVWTDIAKSLMIVAPEARLGLVGNLHNSVQRLFECLILGRQAQLDPCHSVKGLVENAVN